MEWESHRLYTCDVMYSTHNLDRILKTIINEKHNVTRDGIKTATRVYMYMYIIQRVVTYVWYQIREGNGSQLMPDTMTG